GNRLAQFLVQEIVDANLVWLALGPPLTARVLEIPYQLLLFRVHRDHRLAALLEAPGLGVDVLELGIAVGMLPAFTPLAIGLQAITRLVQEGRHRALTDAVTWPG